MGEHGIVVNTRIMGIPIAGVQRYTAELLARWKGSVEQFAPSVSLHGLRGHLWEQLILPLRLGGRGRLLFSPSNTGPLEVREQVLTIHDAAVFDYPEGFTPEFAAWYRMLIPRLIRRVRRVITVSEFTKGRLLIHAKVRPEKIIVVPNGVSSRFCPDAISGLDETISRLKLPSRSYVLTVGSLEKRKNLHRLLEAWSRVPATSAFEPVWLVIVGAKGRTEVFQDLGWDKLPDRVFFTGHVEEHLLPSLYAGAVAFVYPSLYEGFGLPPLEAMASGTPVLVGDCSSLPEVVGDAGLLVDPCDPEAIACGLRRLIDDSALRVELREKGIARSNHFSWDFTARKTWDVLQMPA